jgi:hypothetical protein
MTYLWDGHVVARALFLHHFTDYYGVRSFFYSLGILPFHWNISPWPIVALQCLLVAWIVWLLALISCISGPFRFLAAHRGALSHSHSVSQPADQRQLVCLLHHARHPGSACLSRHLSAGLCARHAQPRRAVGPLSHRRLGNYRPRLAPVAGCRPVGAAGPVRRLRAPAILAPRAQPGRGGGNHCGGGGWPRWRCTAISTANPR